MRQYLDVKAQHKDCIIFFRMGDFYEMFFEDAVTASKVLEITLTSRNKGKEDSIPLCGFPYHAASSYIAKLIDKGFKVAICEQVEDPKEAKGIVRREVVRIVTPGLVVESSNLEAKENNFFAGFAINGGSIGLAFTDISTGEFWVTESNDADLLLNEISGLDFREVIAEEDLKGDTFFKNFIRGKDGCLVDYLPSEYFSLDGSQTLFKEYFHQDQLDTINFEKKRAMSQAACAVLRYVKETQKEGLGHINEIRWYPLKSYLLLDDTARRNLELFATIQGNKKAGSLFHVLDKTVTSMGGRRLRWWLTYPLVDTGKIRERLIAVAEIKDKHHEREALRKLLSRVYDMERLGSRVAMGIANARDLVSLKHSLQSIPPVREEISQLESPLITEIRSSLDEMPDIVGLLEGAIVEDPPMTIREGYILKEGFDGELDELILASTDGKRWIASLEEEERKKTGIHTLKVGFNNVFGYYIEVTRANSHMVPDEYVRKQTLVNAERYINEDLKKYESLVLNAEERRKSREYDLFIEIREQVGKEIRRIQQTASHIADLDALVSLAEVAEQNNYCCPKITDDDGIYIKDGRHPVVEGINLEGVFVPNDTSMDCENNRLLIITGPNMAGKSTYIRQVAIIVLMAQMGSFVPAGTAEIGVADKIFTRVGASDSLAKGQSTFMVEMTEVATILKNATQRSLILLDEVGRGTSTFDGLSIAWAVAEYIHDSEGLGARTLFATHYHELTDLARTREGVKNYSIAVKEWGEDIIFLRKIIEGGTNRSYGIQVARLAGVPETVVARAKEVLKNLEKGELDDMGIPRLAGGRVSDKKSGMAQLSLFAEEENPVLKELKTIDPFNMTPMEALKKIDEWKKKIQG